MPTAYKGFGAQLALVWWQPGGRKKTGSLPRLPGGGVQGNESRRRSTLSCVSRDLYISLRLSMVSACSTIQPGFGALWRLEESKHHDHRSLLMQQCFLHTCHSSREDSASDLVSSGPVSQLVLVALHSRV